MLRESKYNKWLNSNLREGIFKNVANVNQIPNLKYVSTSYDYVLYHIFLMEVTTIYQLAKVTGLTIREVRNSLKKLNNKNYVDSLPFNFYGSIVNFIFLNSTGLDRVNTVFGNADSKKIRKVTHKDLKHFVEVNSLHINLFNHLSNLKMTKEKILRVNREEVIRSDAVYDIKYTSAVEEQVVLEHDRGSERSKKLKEKLFQYAIAMRVNNISNVSFSVSKESLMSKAIADAMWDIPEIENMKIDMKVLSEVKDIANKYMCKSFRSLLESYKTLLETPTDQKIREEFRLNEITVIDYHSKFSRFKELVGSSQKVKSVAKNEHVKLSRVIQILNDDLDCRQRSCVEQLINEYLMDKERERCKLIKSIIINQDDYLELSNKQIRKFEIEDFKNVFDEGMTSSIRSFKMLLLTHECLILPMQEMASYYKWKVRLNENLNRSLINYFNLKEEDYEVSQYSIIIHAGEHVIEKKENSFLLERGSKKYGFVILNTSAVFSDELKMNVIVDNRFDLSSELDVIFCVDVANCNWDPTMEQNMSNLHNNWHERILKIES